MVSGGLAPSSGLLFSHPMSTGIEYWFYGFFLFHYAILLGIREFAHCWGRDSRDHRGYQDGSRLLEIRFC